MKKIKTTCLSAFLLLALYSCDDFVSVEVPDTQLSGNLVFEDVRTAEAALVTIYSKMQSSVLVSGDAGGLSVLLGNYTDELACYGSNVPELLFYQNGLQASNATAESLWRNTYNLLYLVNTVIGGVENSASLAQADRDRLMGESLFVRAYLHFYLNQLFGAIPYVTSTDYRANAVIGRQDGTALLALLDADLSQSESLLSDSYTGSFRSRPNKSTVRALQARLCLYRGQWDLARQKASAVIENTALYQWVDDLDAVFLRGSTGTIWQLMSAPDGKNTLEAKSFIFTTAPPPNRALQPDFISQFEAGDLRKTHWIKGVAGSEATYYHPYKYKLNNDTGTSMEYPIQFRLEEMYLIRAEAHANLNETTLSAADLNKIRNRAGLGDTAAQTAEALLASILEARRAEFFCELGHRFFDLKRLGLLDAVLGATKPGWDSTDALLPIPESELLLNPNLAPQNQGY